MFGESATNMKGDLTTASEVVHIALLTDQLTFEQAINLGTFVEGSTGREFECY